MPEHEENEATSPMRKKGVQEARMQPSLGCASSKLVPDSSDCEQIVFVHCSPGGFQLISFSSEMLQLERPS